LPLFNGSPVHTNAAIHYFIVTLFNNVMALQVHYALRIFPTRNIWKVFIQ